MTMSTWHLVLEPSLSLSAAYEHHHATTTTTIASSSQQSRDTLTRSLWWWWYVCRTRRGELNETVTLPAFLGSRYAPSKCRVPSSPSTSVNTKRLGSSFCGLSAGSTSGGGLGLGVAASSWSASAAAAGSGVSAAAAAGSSVAATTTERKRSATRRRASVLSSERTAIVVLVAVSSGAERGRWRCERQQSKRARERAAPAGQTSATSAVPSSFFLVVPRSRVAPANPSQGWFHFAVCGSLPLVPYEPRTTNTSRLASERGNEGTRGLRCSVAAR